MPLMAVVFFNVSGGPYGIEDMVPSFGPRLTLLLLVVTPILWSLPVSLAVGELASAMPEEGGYVAWTTAAFGRFWGFQVGWWSWIDSFVDVAVYPALFVEYLRFWHPAMTVAERWLLAVAFIVLLTGLNLLGVRPVGRAAVVLGALSMAPVAVFVLVGAGTAVTAASSAFATETGAGASLGLGLAVVMWNYSGWDTPSTCLGETRAPERAFRRALLMTVPVVALAYILPVAVGLAGGVRPWAQWETGVLPTLAGGVGGPWLGHLVAAGAVTSTAGLFMALLLTNSRLPYVLARAGLVPAPLAFVDPRSGSPRVAVLVSAACYAGFAVFSFKELIVLNVWLYSLALLVELAAFLKLRWAAPELPRPWRVPGGWPGAVLVAVLPAAFAVLAMATAGWHNTAAGLAAALTGPLAYALAARGRRGCRG